MNQKTKKNYLILIILGSLIISNCLVEKFDFQSLTIFSPASLFTYFGVLIGFSITIYTFGLSLVSNIKDKIITNSKLNQTEKNKIQKNLFTGFTEIKDDIWIIFIALISVIIFSIAKLIENPFDFDVEKYKIPETINLTLFIITSIAMWDIIKTLFNLAEINFELNKIED
jgi:hypothetical protein